MQKSIKYIITFIFLSMVFTTADLKAQVEEQDELKKENTFFFTFDNSRTFIRGKNHGVNGFKLGANVREEYRIGLGYYTLSADIVDEILVKRQERPDTILSAQLGMNWLAGAYEWIFYANDKWEFTVPVNIGMGTSFYEYFEDGAAIKTKQGSIFVLETGAAGHYKIVKWVGLGFGVGYRTQVVKNEFIDEKFDAPFYVFKVKLFLGEIYRSIKGNFYE